jgi:hypothetical protein
VLRVLPDLRLERTVGPGGSVTTAIGTGFPAGEAVLDWEPGIGGLPAVADAAGRLRAEVLVFHGDRLGPRELTVTAPADPVLAALRPSFLVVPSTAEPSGFIVRD